MIAVDKFGFTYDAPDADDETPEHYHVVTFWNGCLNEYDSGPIDNWDDASGELFDLIDIATDNGETLHASIPGERYVSETGLIYKIESCTEDCSDEYDA